MLFVIALFYFLGKCPFPWETFLIKIPLTLSRLLRPGNPGLTMTQPTLAFYMRALPEQMTRPQGAFDVSVVSNYFPNFVKIRSLHQNNMLCIFNLISGYR